MVNIKPVVDLFLSHFGVLINGSVLKLSAVSVTNAFAEKDVAII
jgi:hypothetical protein